MPASRPDKTTWLDRIWARSASEAGIALAEPEAAPPTRPDLVTKMIDRGRHALLLRPQIAPTLPEPALRKACEKFLQMMSRVPGGDVLVENWVSDQWQDMEQTPADLRRLDIQPLYLARWTVTHQEYQSFVDEDGYRQESFWQPSIWSRVSEFTDRTGNPGPRYWTGGRFPAGQARHPVVGVSWFEADAYARWIGQRLPTDAEWVKAACWPMESDTGELTQRRYPWGDTPDDARANLWRHQRGGTLAVDALPESASAGGVLQMIGNVWEWTASPFRPAAGKYSIELDQPMMTIRGAAFDTYFDNQATCQIHSADTLMARRDNIGFRCAISACDVAGDPGADG